jgi:dihydropyrimidine dehydrogenase (NAD+) subunit PreT
MLEINQNHQGILIPLDAKTLAQNFAKIKPPMTDSEAVIEASRCLFCHDAPCTIACPSAIDIPMFIRQLSSRNAKGAAKTIFSQNILGKACAVVCPTQVLCEGSCVYHGLNEKPIDIGRLQGYATDLAIAQNIRFFIKGQPTGKKVAVVGGGPAGLSCAHELTRLGHTVVVYDASEKAGGLNMYGVAPYKLGNEDAAQEVAYVSEIGFEIRTGTRVLIEMPENSNGKPAVLLSELEQEFDAIFLGIGLGKSHRPGIPGEQLPGAYGAAEFIYSLREHDLKVPVGQRVVVIGAGNTAIDAAVETAKLGAEVTLVYRRRPEDQSAYSFEAEHARLAGVNFRYLTTPVEIVGNTQVEGLRCLKNEVVNTLINPQDNPESIGKTVIEPVPESEFMLPCDMVIFATGQEKMVDFYSRIPGLMLEHGKVTVNEIFQTANPHYFAGGDCVNGGKEVVNAVAHGRDAARGIDQFLNGGKA